MPKKIVFVRRIWQTLLVTNWIIILAFWWKGSGNDILAGQLPMILVALGRIAGLIAAHAILLQFFFMGRLPFLERVFGLDKLSRIHQTNGKLGISLLLFHPILLIAGYNMVLGIPLLTQLKGLFQSDDIVKAILGLVLFCIVVGTSITLSRKHFRYESWYFVHLLAYLAVFFSFGHQIELGHTITTNTLFYGYWIALYSIVFGTHIIFRFGRPLYNFFRHDFRVARIVRESPTTVSLYISGTELGKFSAHPGQFMIVRFFSKKLWWQAHPFSLSMVPNGHELRITVKELGDFTKEVQNIAVGTRILIDGPYGVFTSIFATAPKALFIAGGIGIAPIRSLSEELVKNGKEATLLYANRNQSEIVFKQELEDVAQKHPLQIVHVLSDEPSFQGEKGYIDEEKLKRLVPDIVTRDVFLCGPPPMMTALIKTLESLGVAKPHIHFEKFSF